MSGDITRPPLRRIDISLTASLVGVVLHMRDDGGLPTKDDPLAQRPPVERLRLCPNLDEALALIPTEVRELVDASQNPAPSYRR